MSVYTTQNKWGSGSWQVGGTFVIGARGEQKVVALDATSPDNGKTLNGTMTYAGEGPIHFRATLFMSNNYMVENRWGDSDWQEGGNWVIGARCGQDVVAFNVTSPDNGQTLTGSLTYSNEGPIDFQGKLQS